MPKLIIGLGNPGRQYQNTFHNIGFCALDALADRLGKRIEKNDCQATVAVFSRNNDKIILAKPQTYMNLSGIAANGLMKKHGVAPEDTVVIYDDIDLPCFALRARRTGSAGTHNGMKSVISEVGSTDIARIRIGIGRGEGDLADFVLSKIHTTQQAKFDQLLADLAAVLAEFLRHGDFDRLMREVNAQAD